MIRGNKRNRFRNFRIKNSLIIANIVSNLIGISIAILFSYQSIYPSQPDLAHIARSIHALFLPTVFGLALIITLIYERPIRRVMNAKIRSDKVSVVEEMIARRRLLNEPFFLIALDLLIWIMAAFLYPAILSTANAHKATIWGIFFTNLQSGLITTTTAFFVFEFFLQRRVIPHFFSGGGLYETPGTIKIRIRTRLIAFLFACNIIPFFSLLSIPIELRFVDMNSSGLSETFSLFIVVYSLTFMAVGVWLCFLISGNLTKPIQAIIRVLRDVQNGNFDSRIRVTSNDEIGYTGDVINEMNQGLKEGGFIKETFGKYVSEEVRDEILSGNIPLDGEMKNVTVLFADLRDFTPMVESLPPKEVVLSINTYFQEMAAAIRAHNGLVLQYIGDEIEAVFGAPLSRQDHAELAVRAAMDMTKKLASVNRDIESRGNPPLAHGIGIHSGPVLAANIGSPERLSYALVGDTVNLASRLQGLNKTLGTEMILSKSTFDRLNDPFPVRRLPDTRVKGKDRPVEIYGR